jgi:hypothetical protein
LERLPNNPERLQRELPLQLTLGPALIPVKGWAVPETFIVTLPLEAHRPFPMRFFLLKVQVESKHPTNV